jgi:glycine/D-amino acid oxidase-like deaminating enzyme
MGASIALYLARRGFLVTLVDAAGAPLDRASRWNEGKIHLGYLYANDRSLATARRLIPGGLAFAELLGELIHCDVRALASVDDEIYLIHTASVVDADTVGRYFEEVSRLVCEQPDAGRYLTDCSRARAQRLTRAELAALTTSSQIVAGFRVPERSVPTNILAEGFVNALSAEPAITLALSTRVQSVTAAGTNRQWRVQATPDLSGTFDVVVNALWEGRPEIDRTVGFEPEGPWSHRYRVSLFIETARALRFPSVLIGTGPFGDVKNYDGRHFYVSWYPAGLLVDSQDVTPVPPGPLDAAATASVIAAVRAGLTPLVPSVAEVFDSASQVLIRGGWVFAQGQGTLDDPMASLHRRDRFGVRRLGSYISVDTGKYSTAPWLARSLAAEIAQEVFT